MPTHDRSTHGLHRRAVLRAGLASLGLGALGGGALLRGASAAHAETAAGAAAAKPFPINLMAPNKGSTSAIYPVLMKGDLVDLSGLDISWVGTAPGQMQLQLLSGALNVGGYGALGIAEAQLKGADVTLFAPLSLNHGSFIVPAGSGVRSIGDLKGKRIATVPVNTDTFRQAEVALALHGLNLRKDFQVSHSPGLASLALFERGDVDAILAIEPNSTRLVAKGAREIARVEDLWNAATGNTEPLFLVGWAARKSWLDANPQVAAQVAKAYLHINRELRKDPSILKQPELYGALGLREDETAAIALLPERIGRVTPVEWNAAVFANIGQQIDLALKYGTLDARPAAPLYTVLPGVS
ncbi:PhnD/SsuA/transferrin family substrate-binding protein [Xanthobacter sp. V4C-4]|uniref:ABC transporter substrate-binding protein n=1 Tax=Xanthobacter cornucopiae TaxID=3119924 RepID=UPI003727B9D5